MNVDVRQLKEMVEVQGRDGNWNYSPYHLGLFNGMEFMLSIVEKREPKFRDEPKRYIKNIKLR